MAGANGQADSGDAGDARLAGDGGALLIIADAFAVGIDDAFFIQRRQIPAPCPYIFSPFQNNGPDTFFN